MVKYFSKRYGNKGRTFQLGGVVGRANLKRKGGTFWLGGGGHVENSLHSGLSNFNRIRE